MRTVVRYCPGGKRARARTRAGARHAINGTDRCRGVRCRRHRRCQRAGARLRRGVGRARRTRHDAGRRSAQHRRADGQVAGGRVRRARRGGRCHRPRRTGRGHRRSSRRVRPSGRRVRQRRHRSGTGLRRCVGGYITSAGRSRRARELHRRTLEPRRSTSTSTASSPPCERLRGTCGRAGPVESS